ncbi:hypothetical protein KAR91_26560 [Candidatus Pacearchaeota archaeon]|nr:hypothetical protein [Candidatus Pacearchaeota archaeon]
MVENKEQQCGEFRVSGWHLKKEVTIGQLITIVCILVSGLWWASSVETRIERLTAEDRRIEQKNDIQNKNIEKILGRIERKQDKLFDKMEEKANK